MIHPTETRLKLKTLVAALPTHLHPDKRDDAKIIPFDDKQLEQTPLSVMRSWTHYLPLRHQGVLSTAVRGCDGALKEDTSKSFSRMIRRAILNPADHRETQRAKGFFGFNPNTFAQEFANFLHSLDQYPLHYIMHLTHAAEVIAYYHPNEEFRDFFLLAYELIVDNFHLKPESKQDLYDRLTYDRVEAGTSERNF